MFTTLGKELFIELSDMTNDKPNTALVMLQEVTFSIEEHLVAVYPIDADEWVLLSSSGQLFRYKVGEAAGTSLLSVANYQGIHYSDGGFDLNAQISLYALGDIVVLVNDFKTHGYIDRRGKKGPRVHLWREDYHADISRFPIALFLDHSRIPHLIHATAWNRLDILNLETLQNLTAAKSLIQEGAEQRHLEWEKGHPDLNANNIPWPGSFDYFYGPLILSPDKSRFLSKGWCWGSADCCCVFEIVDFISDSRLTVQFVGSWEHSNRGICWVDDTCIAVLCSPFEEGDEGSSEKTPFEIRLYQADAKSWEQADTIQLAQYQLLDSELVYDIEQELFCAFTLYKEGFTIIDLSGQTVFEDKSIIIHSYNGEKRLFSTLKEKHVATYGVNDVR